MKIIELMILWSQFPTIADQASCEEIGSWMYEWKKGWMDGKIDR